MAEFKYRKRHKVATNDEKKKVRYDISLTKMAKRELLITLISILGVTMLSIGSAFAIFTTSSESAEYNVLKTGTLEIDFGEETSTINLSNGYPMSDTQGLASDPYIFKITNTGSLDAYYTVSILDDDEMITADNCAGNQLNKDYIKYTLNDNTIHNYSEIVAAEGEIDSGMLAPGESKTYTLRLWLREGAGNDVLGKHYHGKIVVNGQSYTNLTVAETLLAGVGENGSINTSDPDQTFITGTDPNNYIWYSGKLWRAVSIDPTDNSVKLVTQWDISLISYNPSGNTAFEGSYMETWLNDTSVDGFLGNLRNYENFIKMDSTWNATMMTTTSKPPKTTMVEDAVGLLNIYEYTMSYNGTIDINGYLNNGLYWWTLTPSSTFLLRHVSSDGTITSIPASDYDAVRPAINLKSSVKVVSGDGSENNPYRLEGDNDSYLNGTLLNTRYSGEYIKFGEGENTLYRIVSHETSGLTKITSAEPLKNNGEFIISAFDSNKNVNYSSSNTIGTFLNGEYLTSYVGDSYSNMIEESTTWYLGTVGYGDSYRLAKYSTATGNELTTNQTTAQVGLLRFGELMAGQFDRYGNNTAYWTLTPYNSYVRYMDNDGGAGDHSLTDASGVRPSMNLKSSVIITGGSGTKSDPFVLS